HLQSCRGSRAPRVPTGAGSRSPSHRNPCWVRRSRTLASMGPPRRRRRPRYPSRSHRRRVRPVKYGHTEALLRAWSLSVGIRCESAQSCSFLFKCSYGLYLLMGFLQDPVQFIERMINVDETPRRRLLQSYNCVADLSAFLTCNPYIFIDKLLKSFANS